MVASLVTLYKKLKFVTDENVGWGPIDLPEIELQTTAYWLTAEGAATGWRRDELDVALIGAGRAIQAVAAVLLMLDPRDLGLVSQVRSPHHEAPTIYLYEAMPGGVGLSERLWARHDELVSRGRRPAPRLPVRCRLPGLHRAAAGAGRGRQGARAAAPRVARARSRREPAATRRRSRDRRAVRAGHARAAAREPAGDARPRGRGAGGHGPDPGPGAVRGPPEPAARRDGWPPRSAPTSPTRRMAGSSGACVPALDIPVDRERLSRLPGHPPPDAPLVCLDTETTGLATAAGTLAFLVGLARWDGTSFRQTQLLLPDHADEPALLAEIARWVTPDTWLVSYNGRGLRLAAHRGPLPAGGTTRARPTPGTWTCCRSSGACSSTGWRTRGCAPSRASCWASAGSATSRAGRSPRSTSTCCAAGRSTRSPAS